MALPQVDWVLFLHIAGLIIGLGAVTVIDTLGFLARKSKELTQTTIEAHHVTKPLIWLGTGLVAVSWLLMAENSTFGITKTALLLVLIANGSFLSFYVSPRLDKMRGKKQLLPKELQRKIAASMMVSFLGWWSFVIITVGMVK